jgi:hypothetical protein
MECFGTADAIEERICKAPTRSTSAGMVFNALVPAVEAQRISAIDRASNPEAVNDDRQLAAALSARADGSVTDVEGAVGSSGAASPVVAISLAAQG